MKTFSKQVSRFEIEEYLRRSVKILSYSEPSPKFKRNMNEAKGIHVYEKR